MYADDPGVTIQYADENAIHNAMSLPTKPAEIPLGTTPKESKENLMKWMDKMMKSVSRPECLIVDGDGIRIRGVYEGLRIGEWGKALHNLQSDTMEAWHCELYQNNMSCGQLILHCGNHGRGRSTASRVKAGPFSR